MKKEKIYNLILFILLFLSILSIIILRPLNNLDELWNYNFARNIADGLIPYRDFNMLQMPLLPMICGIILKIITNELIVMRILAALLCSAIIYTIYKLFIIINCKKEIAIIFTFFIAILFKKLFCIDYNYATLLIVLYIIINEIKLYQKNTNFIDNNKKIDLLLGILAGLTITLKQTTGIFVCIALLGNKLLFVKDRNEFKLYLKSFLFRIIGVIISVSIMLMYLILNGAFIEFIRYTITGVSGFSNYIPYSKLIRNNFIGILSLLVPITYIYEWIKCIILDRNKIGYIFLVYSLAMFVVCFPISDEIHFLIGALPILILIMYELYCIFNKLYYKVVNTDRLRLWLKGIIIFINYLIILLACCTSFFYYMNYYKISEYYSDLNHYRYIPISKSTENEINSIINYINASEDGVLILDATAAIYMIPLNRYNKDYDMLLKGNLGHNGENKVIKDIQKRKNTKYLILKNKYNKNWQTPMNIINFVQENKEKVEEIEIFDIYK